MTPEQQRQPTSGVDQQETTPAEERGERLDTGKSIARGGKEGGHVPGAEPDPSRGRETTDQSRH